LARLGVLRGDPPRMPTELWTMLEHAPLGEAVEWRAPQQGGSWLGCTRYEAEGGAYLLLMREVSDKRAQLTETIRRQRLESSHRLAASVAHDLRGTVAGIVYGADFLESNQNTLQLQTYRETVRDLCAASTRLQLTVDALLDFARLGPSISVPVSLAEIMNRAQSMLHTFYRDGLHRLRVELAEDCAWVRGNPIVIEQIFVNLLLHVAERAAGPRLVSVSSSATSASLGTQLFVRMVDEASEPYAPHESPACASLAEQCERSLVLSDARAAAESQGGRLLLETTRQGGSFAVFLPRSEGPRCDF
jgi:signal transduction histidine kinase